MKLQEAIKFKNRSRLLDRLEGVVVGNFKKIYKPGKKVGIDLFNTVMAVMGRGATFIVGDAEDIGRSQLKKLLKELVLKIHTFPFDDEDMKKAFKDALIADIKKLKSQGYM